MHKITCCYKEKACDKCVIHADRKFCFIEANQTVFDNLLRYQLQHLFRLAVAVYRFTCFCRAIFILNPESSPVDIACVNFRHSSAVKASENFPPSLGFITNQNITKLECNEYQKEMVLQS